MKRSASPQGRNPSPPPLKRKIESTTTNKAVNAFFKPASLKQPEKLEWSIIDQSLLIGKYNQPAKHVQSLNHPVKVAAFDLDDTLILPNANNRWERSATSWKWFDTSVPGRIRQLHQDRFAIVIISNQRTVSLKDNPKTLQKDTLSLKNLKAQVSSLLTQLDVPVILYAATAQDKYRKPRVGTWDRMKKDLGLESKDAIDMTKSYYIGDAAGRGKTDKGRKDHASCDLELALNVGIDFKTPEEFFMGANSEPYGHDFNPKTFLKGTVGDAQTAMSFKKRGDQEMVVFCGSPGSGKSSFFWKTLQPQGYERINQDILKTRDRCLRAAREMLKAGSSIAIDNTNADAETRAHWVRLAREFDVPVRCIHFTASTRLCEHNDAFRAHNKSMNPENRSILPPIAFRSFNQRFSVPKLQEGFQDITLIEFEFFGSITDRDLYSQYWVSNYST